MNFWSSIKGIISFIKEKITRIYQVYKSRTSPYREMIYSKQLEGYSEVIFSLADWYITSRLFIALKGGKLDDKTRPQLSSHTRDKSITFHDSYRKWGVFFPKE